MDSRILIIGAGIGGLSTAHSLIRKGINPTKITVIERNAEAGGMARSSINEKGYPTEYCWRAYGAYYKYIIDNMAEIPFNKQITQETSQETNQQKTVKDDLVELPICLFVKENGEVIHFNSKDTRRSKVRKYYSLIKKLSFLDYFKLIYKRCTCPSDPEVLDQMRFKDYIGNVSEECKKLTVYPPGIFFGQDIDEISVWSIKTLFPSITGWLYSKPITFRVLNGPTNENFINPWVEYLTSKGVTFKFNTTVTSIQALTNSNGITNIETVTIKENVNNIEQLLNPGKIVACLPIEELAKLMPDIAYRRGLTLLKENSKQIQCSISYYLSEKMLFPEGNTTLFLVDSPWVIMILPLGHLFKKNVSEYGKGSEHFGKIKDIWEIGIGHTNKKGYNGKTFLECTREEAIKEAWDQCMKSKVFESGCITESGVPVSEVRLVDSYMWESFEKDENGMDTWEPKFSNNIMTRNLRPRVQSPINNMYVATAYVHDSDIDNNIFHMEAAAMSGQVAAELIIQN